MNEKEILNSLKESIDKAPTDILDRIKEAPREKMLRHDHITRQDNRPSPFKKFMPYASLVAAFVLVFFGWQYQVKLQDSHIYLDVNPSVEIVTNRRDKVINILADNVDGERIAKDIDYKGRDIYDVTEEILDKMMDENYLHKDHEFLLLSVYNKNQNKAEEQKQSLDKKIHDHLQAKDLQPIVLLQKLDKTSTIEDYAKKYGISVSKMNFIRNLIILNPDLETEDLVDLSIEQLVDLSQGMGLELEKIIESTDFDRILTPSTELDLEPEPDPIPDDDYDNDDDNDQDENDDDDDDHDHKDIATSKQDTKEVEKNKLKNNLKMCQAEESQQIRLSLLPLN